MNSTTFSQRKWYQLWHESIFCWICCSCVRDDIEIFWFACRFVLSPDDPNYETYADMDHEPGAQIRYYVHLAENLRAEE